MNNQGSRIGALIFVVLSLSCQTSLFAQGIGEVYILPSSQMDWRGDTDTLWVALNQDCRGLKMVSFSIGYEPGYVTPTQVITGPDLPGGSFFDGRVLPDGSVLIDIGFLSSAFDGPGILAGIVLTAHTAVSETRLDFSRSVVRDALNADVEHTTRGASLEIRQRGTVFLQPDSTMISGLDTLSIELRVGQNATGIHCFMVSVDFDTTLLKIVGITEGPLLKTGGPTFFFSDSLKHPVDIGSCLLGYGLQVNGPGVLATVKFKAFQKGGTSPITLPYVKLSDVDLDSMVVEHSGGTVVVQGLILPEITSTPPPAGLVGELYTYDVEATGFPIPTYELQARPLPPVGMTIDAVTGVIEWTPLTAGDYDVMVVVSNAAGSCFQGFAIRVYCCSGRVGDVNRSGDDEPTIGDVSVLIDALFIAGDSGIIECLPEADINQSGGDIPQFEDISIGDISTLIDYLFITGPSLGLPECL